MSTVRRQSIAIDLPILLFAHLFRRAMENAPESEFDRRRETTAEAFERLQGKGDGIAAIHARSNDRPKGSAAMLEKASVLAERIIAFTDQCLPDTPTSSDSVLG